MADQACPSSSAQNNLVQQLCRLVENLHEQNHTTQRRADTRDNRPETVGEAISRLFPSINGRSNSSVGLQQPKAKQAVPAVIIIMGLQTVYLVLNHNRAHRNKGNEKAVL